MMPFFAISIKLIRVKFFIKFLFQTRKFTGSFLLVQVAQIRYFMLLSLCLRLTLFLLR